jgi:hypothetical protein
MKSKQFFVLLLIAVVLLALGLYVNRSRDRDWESGADGATILPGLKATDVVSFTVQNDTGTTTVEFADGIWRVRERNGYPAKYERLATFLEELRDQTATQTVAAGQSQYGRLKLNDPGQDDAGALVTLYNRDGGEIAAVVFGREYVRKDAGTNPMMPGDYPIGRYLRVKGGQDVFLVDKTFSQVDEGAGRWLDDQFFRIGDIREASLTKDGEVQWTASREDKSAELQLQGEVPEGKEVDTGKLTSIKSAFSWARFNDVLGPGADPETTGLAQPTTFVAREFGGIVYTVSIGSKTDEGKYHLTVQAAYEGPEARTPGEDEKPEDKEKLDQEFGKTLAEAQKKVADLNARAQGWVYLVDSWAVDTVVKTRDELLKDKPKPAAEPAAEAAGE